MSTHLPPSGPVRFELENPAIEIPDDATNVKASLTVTGYRLEHGELVLTVYVGSASWTGGTR